MHLHYIYTSLKLFPHYARSKTFYGIPGSKIIYYNPPPQKKNNIKPTKETT